MTTKSTTATALRWVALLVLAGSLGTWAFTGANRGWTRTEATSLARDEITGLDYPVTTKAFQPGLDALALGLGLSLLLGGLSWRSARRASQAR